MSGGDNRNLLWKPEQDAELRRLHSEGKTYSQIGLAMGMTKNKVIGRAQRLGLAKPRRQSGPITPKQSFPRTGCCLYTSSAQSPFQWCGRPTTSIESAWCAEHEAIVFDRKQKIEAA